MEARQAAETSNSKHLHNHENLKGGCDNPPLLFQKSNKYGIHHESNYRYLARFF